MRMLLLLLTLVSCNQEIKDRIGSGYNEDKPSANTGERVILGRVYNLNGDDYQLTQDKDYDSYTQVFTLSRPNYSETFRFERKLRVDGDNVSSTKITINSSGKTTRAQVVSTHEYIRTCRQNKIGSFEQVCDTFEMVR